MMKRSIALLIDLLGDILVELLPGDLLLAESSHIVHDFLDLLVS